MAGRLHAVTFPGPAGPLEGLWKEASGPRRGSAVVAHPHPLHGGTLHSKAVYRAAQALTRSGYDTLRFNFRGVGASGGRHDDGLGEVDDFRAALGEAERAGGLPIVAGGFSFGSTVALKAAVGDSRVEAFVVLGLPLATESGRGAPHPSVPALFVVGERDTFGPPDLLTRFVRPPGRMIVIPGADHFFGGRLGDLEAAISGFLEALPTSRASRGGGAA